MMMNESGTMPGTGSNENNPAISPQEFQSLVEMVGADMPDVLVDLLDTYTQESTMLVNSIVDAFRNGDVAGMLRPAHSLKSSSASLGAMQLSRLCAALEGYARGNSPGLDVPTVVAAVDQEFQRVAAELNVYRARFVQ
jgi:HPt (histidine-containing phosphotransfer) domain-containing protein